MRLGSAGRKHRFVSPEHSASGEWLLAKNAGITSVSVAGSHEQEFGAVMLGPRHGFELQFMAISYSLVPESLAWLPARFS